MYYRLKEPWAFRGWKKLPFAIRAMDGEKKHDDPFLMEKAPFLDLLCCNGEEDVDPSAFSGKGRKILRELTEHGVIEQSETPLPPLSPYQRYYVYPARKIKSVHWSITGKCNFRCRHCLVSAPNACHPQLPLSDCLHIVDEIAGCGISQVDVTGGEPLVRGDFEEIVRALGKKGVDIGVLFTNASLLTADTLDMLERYRQRPTFQLSFDGLGHHDWLRGVPGAEKQADDAFRLLRDRGYTVNAAMCIHRENRDSLRATANYLAEMNVQNMRVNAPQRLGLWKQYADEYALAEDEVWAAYSEFIPQYFEDGMPVGVDLDGYFSCRKGETKYRIVYVRRARDGQDWSRYPYCGSVHDNVYIGPEGRLAPCMGFADTALKEKFPSVLEHPLAELTLNSFCYDVVQTKVSDLLAKNPDCAACRYLPKCCGGCMVEGITDEGDYLVPDSRFCYFHKHIGEEAVRAVADAAIARYQPDRGNKGDEPDSGSAPDCAR